MRTTNASNDPTTIEVNPKNSAFAVDTGAVICEDSIVQKISLVKSAMLNETSRETEKILAIKYYHTNIMGVFEDSWTPKDEKTNLEVEDILEVTRIAAQMDVIPKFNATNLSGTSTQPFSTVTMTEVFGDYTLSGNADSEGVTFDLDTYFNSKKFFTNGGKVTAASPRMDSTIISQKNGGFITSSQTKFLPQRMRFGRRDLFFGELYHLPIFTEASQILDPDQVYANAAYVNFKVIVSFMEWNTEFNQKP